MAEVLSFERFFKGPSGMRRGDEKEIGMRMVDLYSPFHTIYE